VDEQEARGGLLRQARAGISRLFPSIWQGVEGGVHLTGEGIALGLLFGTALSPVLAAATGVGGGAAAFTLLTGVGVNLISDRLAQFLDQPQEETPERVQQLSRQLADEISTNRSVRDLLLATLDELEPLRQLQRDLPHQLNVIAELVKTELAALKVTRPYYNITNYHITTQVVTTGDHTFIQIFNNPTAADGQQLRAALINYLQHVIANNNYIDARGVIQTTRAVQLPMDKVFAYLTATYTPGQADRNHLLREERNRLFHANISFEQQEQLLEQARRGLVESLTIQRIDLQQVVAQEPLVIFLGDPGGGKTTLLRHLAYKRAAAMRDYLLGSGVSDDLRLPIYIRIADYATNLARNGTASLRDFLAVWYINKQCKVDERLLDQIFEQLLEHGLCLVLLDGLDEITSPRERESIRNNIEAFVREWQGAGNRFVVSSRVQGYVAAPLGSDFAEYTLAAMNDDEIAAFINQWCPAVERFMDDMAGDEMIAERAGRESGALLLAVKNEGVRRLAVNPLLLTILALIHREGMRLPNRRIELYTIVADTLIERWLKHNPDQAADKFLEKDEVEAVLTTLAYCMHANRPDGTVTYDEATAVIGALLAEQRGGLDDLRGYGQQAAAAELLRWVREATGLFVERAPKQHGFMHLTFEEYFAARYLVETARTRLSRLRQHLHDPRWQEPILLALGYVAEGSANDGSELLYELCLDPQRDPLPDREEYDERLFHRDLLLALRACADGITLQPKARLLLIKQTVDLYLNVDKGDSRGRYSLLQRQLNEALERLVGSDLSRELATAFSQRASDQQPIIRRYAVYAIRWLQDTGPDVATSLLRLAGDDDAEVRSAVAYTLASLAPSNPALAAELLTRLAGDDNTEVRVRAAYALDSLAPNNPTLVAELLTRLAGDDDAMVRVNAVAAVVKLAPDSPALAAELLTRLAGNDDTEVRANAVYALADLAPDHPALAAELLTRLAGDDDAEVRSAVAIGLDDLAPSNPALVAELLTRLAGDDDVEVRSRVAIGLANLAPSNPALAAELLTRLAGDDNAMVRARVAAALARLADNNLALAAELLTRLAGDDDTMVRVNTIAVVVDLVPDNPALAAELLTRLAGDDDVEVRASAAYALADLAPDHPALVAELLTRLAGDDDAEIQATAAYALADLAPDNPALAAEGLANSSDDWLLANLGAKDYKRRTAAVAELGRREVSRTPAVVQRLLMMLNDSDNDVRKAVLAVVTKRLSDHGGELRQALLAVAEQPARRGTFGSPHDDAYNALYELTGSDFRSTADNPLCGRLPSLKDGPGADEQPLAPPWPPDPR